MFYVPESMSETQFRDAARGLFGRHDRYSQLSPKTGTNEYAMDFTDDCNRRAGAGHGCALIVATTPTGKSIAGDHETTLEPAGASVVRTSRARVPRACN